MPIAGYCSQNQCNTIAKHVGHFKHVRLGALLLQDIQLFRPVLPETIDFLSQQHRNREEFYIFFSKHSTWERADVSFFEFRHCHVDGFFDQLFYCVDRNFAMLEQDFCYFIFLFFYTIFCVCHNHKLIY